MSVLGAYWCRPILGGKSILCIGLFWVQAYFWRERAIFGVRAIGGRKESCKKRRKNNMQKEEKLCGTHAD
jgi:hypothetical protein